MRYYFIASDVNNTYVIAARSAERARAIAEQSGIKIVSLYELTRDAFTEEGFLISWE